MKHARLAVLCDHENKEGKDVTTYLITGASSGMGYHMTRLSIQRGHRVYGVARRESILADMEEKLGKRFTAIRCDVTDRQRVSQVCAALPTLPDVAILNAGQGIRKPEAVFALEDYRHMAEVNYFGALHWIEALLPSFVERGSGVIAGVSSLAGYRGLPKAGHYCASKAALSAALESLRLTYADRGVRFMTIHPGFVDTPMTRGMSFPMPLIWSAEKAADFIVRQIERGGSNIAFPLPLRFMSAVGRLLPGGLYQRIVKLQRPHSRLNFP